jgi:hypothetical protein
LKTIVFLPFERSFCCEIADAESAIISFPQAVHPTAKKLQFASAESNKLMRKKLCNLALAADLGHLRSTQHAGFYMYFTRDANLIINADWTFFIIHDNPAAEAVKS